jgi:hypothetical protein
MVFLIETNDYQKMCDTNKNVTKMGMLMKGVYYSSNIKFGHMMWGWGNTKDGGYVG